VKRIYPNQLKQTRISTALPAPKRNKTTRKKVPQTNGTRQSFFVRSSLKNNLTSLSKKRREEEESKKKKKIMPASIIALARLQDCGSRISNFQFSLNTTLRIE